MESYYIAWRLKNRPTVTGHSMGVFNKEEAQDICQAYNNSEKGVWYWPEVVPDVLTEAKTILTNASKQSKG